MVGRDNFNPNRPLVPTAEQAVANSTSPDATESKEKGPENQITSTPAVTNATSNTCAIDSGMLTYACGTSVENPRSLNSPSVRAH